MSSQTISSVFDSSSSLQSVSEAGTAEKITRGGVSHASASARRRLLYGSLVAAASLPILVRFAELGLDRWHPALAVALALALIVSAFFVGASVPSGRTAER